MRASLYHYRATLASSLVTNRRRPSSANTAAQRTQPSAASPRRCPDHLWRARTRDLPGIEAYATGPATLGAHGRLQVAWLLVALQALLHSPRSASSWIDLSERQTRWRGVGDVEYGPRGGRERVGTTPASPYDAVTAIIASHEQLSKTPLILVFYKAKTRTVLILVCHLEKFANCQGVERGHNGSARSWAQV